MGIDVSSIKHERGVIAQLFRDHRVFVRPGKIKVTPVNAMIALHVRAGERIKSIRDLLPEINLAVSNVRGIETRVRLNDLPLFLDIPHHNPRPLYWQSEREFKPHHALAGRGWTYAGGRDQWVSLDSEPHALIAGITGSGKSVLMLNMILSLAMGTPPGELDFVLIDLKNEAFPALTAIPHVQRYAGDPDSAVEVARYVFAEMERRRDLRGVWSGKRLVLAIDELAQLPDEAKEIVTRVSALGRSLRVNVFSATQHPTAAVLGGSTGKVNYVARFTGMVADANAAQTASGRPQTGAQFLPGNGAFIRTGGANVTRLQSFLIRPEDVASVVNDVCGKWGDRVSVVASVADDFVGDYFAAHCGPDGRLTGRMADAIRNVLNEEPARGRAQMRQADRVRSLFSQWKEKRLGFAATGVEPEGATVREREDGELKDWTRGPDRARASELVQFATN